jgi:hypothetical protein
VAFVTVVDLFDKAQLFAMSLRSNCGMAGWKSSLLRRGTADGARECSTLGECLREFTVPQSVGDFLIDGQPMMVSVRREFDSVSQVVMVHLSRFKNGNMKATQAVTAEETIEIPVSGNVVEFGLQRVITHSWGHYIAFVKKDGEWFEISDTLIGKSSIEKVQKAGEFFGCLFMYLRMYLEAFALGSDVCREEIPLRTKWTHELDCMINVGNHGEEVSTDGLLLVFEVMEVRGQSGWCGGLSRPGPLID